MLIQLTDNGAVHCDIGGIRRVRGIDKYIAGMHVGVEKTVPEHLGKKYFHATFRQAFHIHAPFNQGRDVGYRHPLDALTDHDLPVCQWPVNLRYVDETAVPEITP